MKDVGVLLCDFVPNCCVVAGINIVNLMEYILLCTARLRENDKFSVKHNIQFNFMVTPCFNNIQHCIDQLMHTTLKNVELLKHFKIRKLLQHVSVYKENHHQGATAST